MLLAFTLDPQTASIVGLFITTLGAIVVAWLENKAKTEHQDKYEQEARALQAVILGVEGGVRKVAAGEKTIDAVKDEVKAVATDAGVQDYLHARVQALTNASPPAAPPANP